MEKIAVLLADGMFHNSYSEKALPNAKQHAQKLRDTGRECRLFWTHTSKLEDIKVNYGFDNKVYFLGKPCVNNHFWLNTNQTLRMTKEGRDKNKCVQCRLEGSRRNSKNNNKPEYKEKRKEYRQKNKEILNEKSKQWRVENIDKVKIIVQRANARKRSDQSIFYTNAELQEQFAKFKNECAYCGKKTGGMTIDHMYPVCNGSVDCIENIVPACISCNAGKRNKEMYEWYSKKPFFSQKRFDKIIENTAYALPVFSSNANYYSG